jgi:hypothetical protein
MDDDLIFVNMALENGGKIMENLYLQTVVQRHLVSFALLLTGFIGLYMCLVMFLCVVIWFQVF